MATMQHIADFFEKGGQASLSANTRLPGDFNGCTKADFEAMGIQFHEVVNDIFYRVTLPEGWRIAPTNHSMWSHLLDADGNQRAMIFYKASPWDTNAHISLA